MYSRCKVAASCTSQGRERLIRGRRGAPAAPVLGGLALACLLAGGAQGFQDERADLGRPFERFVEPSVPGRPRPDPTEVPIGIITSSDADYESRVSGALLAVEQANEKGGWHGRPFALWSRPSRGGTLASPWLSAADNARDLIHRFDCLGLIAAPDRNVSHLLAQMAFRSHTPMVSLSYDSALTRIPHPWLVRIVPDTRTQLEALVRSLAIPPTGPIPALLPPGREGRSVRADLASMGPLLGVAFEPLVDYEHEVEVAAARALEGLEADGARPLLVWLDKEMAAQALAQLERIGWKGPVLLPHHLFEGVRKRIEPPPGLECRAVQVFDTHSDDPRAAAFIQAYRNGFGVLPDEAAACAFDATNLLLEAIRGAGCDRSAIRAWLATLGEYEGITGRIRFDGTGNRQQVWPVKIVSGGGAPVPPAAGPAARAGDGSSGADRPQDPPPQGPDPPGAPRREP